MPGQPKMMKLDPVLRDEATRLGLHRQLAVGDEIGWDRRLVGMDPSRWWERQHMLRMEVSERCIIYTGRMQEEIDALTMTDWLRDAFIHAARERLLADNARRRKGDR